MFIAVDVIHFFERVVFFMVFWLNDIAPHKSKTHQLTWDVIFCNFSFKETLALILKQHKKSLATHIPRFQSKILQWCCSHIPRSCLHRCVSTRVPGSKEILLWKQRCVTDQRPRCGVKELVWVALFSWRCLGKGSICWPHGSTLMRAGTSVDFSSVISHCGFGRVYAAGCHASHHNFVFT